MASRTFRAAWIALRPPQKLPARTGVVVRLFLDESRNYGGKHVRLRTAMTRIAAWLIWTAYLTLGVAIAVFSYLVQSKRMDIGSTMTSVILLGATGVVVTIALLSGSVMGTTVLVRNPAARRVGSIATVIAGWAGGIFLAWLSWNFWTN
jgi:hypothetical protein